jgi:phosphoribosylamine--glycine ligase
MEGNKLITNGGRVLFVTGLDINPLNDRKKAYDLLRTIKFKGEYYRHDIGSDLGIN